MGLVYDAPRKRILIKTHFSNELLILDAKHPAKPVIAQRIALPSPEPLSVRAGRHVLYDARLTSSHGDSACASCHIFGDFDGLDWDLGNPDEGTVNNPGPRNQSHLCSK